MATNNRKNYIVTRQHIGGAPIKSAPMTINQAARAVLHFERLGYPIVKMERLE
jgi:hypothetical protein